MTRQGAGAPSPADPPPVACKPIHRVEVEDATWSGWLQRRWWTDAPASGVLALLPLSWLYDALRRLHRLPWRMGWRRAQPTPVPVVVVGNLVVGGVGKTPTVIALVQALRGRGWHPGIVSRGHGAALRRGQTRPVERGDDPAAVGDEPLLLARRTGAPVQVGRKRAQAVLALCRAHPEVDVIVCDDGLQHHALARRAALIVFDERGVGNGRLLPAGPLREPLQAHPPSDSVVLNLAGLPSTAWGGHCAPRQPGAVWSLADWWARTQNAPHAHQSPTDGRAIQPAAGDVPPGGPWSALRGRRWRAVAGIGHPERFFAMLEAEGLDIERWPLPDHAPLSPPPWPADGMPLILTEKDAVKLPPGAGGTAPGVPVVVATLDLSLPEVCVDELLALIHSDPTVGP